MGNGWHRGDEKSPVTFLQQVRESTPQQQSPQNAEFNIQVFGN
jgi:hypothetical protein